MRHVLRFDVLLGWLLSQAFAALATTSGSTRPPGAAAPPPAASGAARAYGLVPTAAALAAALFAALA